MALADALMGLGVSPLLAARTANAGVGPLTITAKGSSATTAQTIQAQQFLCSCSNADNTVALVLPTVGTDNGALLGDDYFINNAGTTSLRIFASSGVGISTGGNNTSVCTLQSHTSIQVCPITTTQWVGVKGS